MNEYKRVARRDEYVLMAVEHVRLGSIRHVADVRVPEDFAVGRVVSNQVAAEVALEQQLAGSCQHAVQSAASGSGRRVLVAPGDLAGLIVDGGEIAAQRCQAYLFLAAETHRAARIGFGQIVHRIAIALRDIEESGIRE